MPVDLVPQYRADSTGCWPALNVPVLELDGYEADDMLATIAHAGATSSRASATWSPADKDARQLITDRVKVYNVRKDQMYDAAALKADWGIRPEQVVDFQALVGDRSTTCRACR